MCTKTNMSVTNWSTKRNVDFEQQKQHARIKNKNIDTLEEQDFKQSKTKTKHNLHATHIRTREWNVNIENLIWIMCSKTNWWKWSKLEHCPCRKLEECYFKSEANWNVKSRKPLKKFTMKNKVDLQQWKQQT